MSERPIYQALLVLADGTVFEGEAFGALDETWPGPATGEVVFNTVLSGYQEVLTDPSYAGQIITFTYPHIGNYGVNHADEEARRPFARGVIVRELARRRSNWRAEGDLDAFLRRHGVPGIAAIDTRRLTRHLRDGGAMSGAFGIVDGRVDVSVDEAALRSAAEAEPGTTGVDLVRTVTTGAPYTVGAIDGEGLRMVAYDFGIKTTILRHLSGLGEVEVVPAMTPAADVLAREPDGVFLSNGPGDPEALPYATEIIGRLLGQVPVFGICLGHQLLARTLGGEITKLPFGHHGGNHPVRRLADDAVEITSQNHNYAVGESTIAGAEVTHVNLNDGVIEGIRCTDVPAFSVQHHPEAGPGPHDSAYLFTQFQDLMASHRRQQRPGGGSHEPNKRGGGWPEGGLPLAARSGARTASGKPSGQDPPPVSESEQAPPPGASTDDPSGAAS